MCNRSNNYDFLPYTFIHILRLHVCCPAQMFFQYAVIISFSCFLDVGTMLDYIISLFSFCSYVNNSFIQIEV